MTISDDIRALADQGLTIAEIARKLNIRDQHAYGVVKKRGSLQPGRSVKRPAAGCHRPDAGPRPGTGTGLLES